MIAQDKIPHIIKYMGGKRELLDEIGSALEKMDVNATDFCDLFSGTAIVSYAFSDSFNVVSNDIQCYSSVFSNTYFHDYSSIEDPEKTIRSIMDQADAVVKRMVEKYHQFNYDYYDDIDFTSMCALEKAQQNLLEYDFDEPYSFFMKSYSGTYWSFEQCLWIDSIRSVADLYLGTGLYYAIMSSLIFAMSYCAQSTGHFAQFRTLTPSNYKSVLLYRLKSVPVLFQKKMLELLTVLRHPNIHSYRITTLDYLDCLATLNPNTIVYADPPYSAVHYSRFYHVLETLVLYDHPSLEFKGRYRTSRYQSPFDQRSKVAKAFEALFKAVNRQHCQLLLSYSDNALLPEEQLDDIAMRCLNGAYKKTRYSKEYKHMKMGRADEYNMDVHELLISYTRR